MVGIILAFSWMVFIANQQRKEIVSLKAQLSIFKDFERDVNESNKDLVQCSNDVEFLKQGLEDLIYAEQHGLK
jgi:hypothetical protein